VPFLIITSDYELPAGGYGDVRRHVIEPTRRMLDICDDNDAKLTIMAEMGELWALEDPQNQSFTTRLSYDPALLIRGQLQETVRRGHDVQLHLHPQWIGAQWRSPSWVLDYSHYHLGDFGHDRMVALLLRGKTDLESMLRPISQGYSCIGYRAGHWNTHPSGPYIAALLAAGLKSDTSVFKWGVADTTATRFDYRNAHSNICAWYACANDINQATSDQTLLELPIYADLVPCFRLFTLRRLRLAFSVLREDMRISAATARGGCQLRSSVRSKLKQLYAYRARKLDFCKMTTREMMDVVDRVLRQADTRTDQSPVPIVMIGHSKEFSSGRHLSRFLRLLAAQFGAKLRFSTYRGFVAEYERYFLSFAGAGLGPAPIESHYDRRII
jgi:hypothetical protein